MEDNAGGSWSDSDLWEAWYEDELNWQNINLEILDEKEEPPNIESHKSDGEIIDQEWPLRDPHGFYYPLFGLGQSDNQIAIVAAGPGHNIEEPWKECTKTSSYREAYRGPLTNASRWFDSSLDSDQEEQWYADDFDVQKKYWMCARLEERTDLVEQLEDIQGHLPEDTLLNTSGSVFDSFYFTNFMKDGEFKKSSRKVHMKDGEFYDQGQAIDKDLQKVDELFSDINQNGKVEFQNHPSDLLNTEDRDDQWLIRPNINDSDDPWEVCEFASREFWLPVLGAELAGVEPNVIVPMGKKAILAIFQLYGIDKDWNKLYEAALDGYRGSETGPAVVPSYHWSGANRNISNNEENLYENLDAGMQDRNDELLESTDEKVTKDTYWRLLANQIARCM
jgi:hypothetical protein